jgi:hypothetical protein
MNQVKFEIQVMKAVITQKRREAAKMKAGAKKTKLLLAINTATKIVNKF